MTDPPDNKTRAKVQQPAAVQNSLSVKIYSPFKVYFDGQADSVSAVNDTGPFDVLPRHHNFLTLLTAGEITVRKAGGDTRYKIDKGVMHVRNNQVTIFLDV